MYHDYMLAFEGDEQSGFTIKAKHRYELEGEGLKTEQVQGPPTPFNAGFFLDESRLQELTAAINRVIDAKINGRPETREVVAAQKTVMRFREALFDAVFQETILAELKRALIFAHLAHCGLRVRLQLPRLLQPIIWELLYLRARIPEEHQHVNVIVVRSHDQADLAPAIIQFPLRILVVVATPLGLEPLDVRKEIEHLLSSLSELIKTGRAYVDFVHGANTLQRMNTLMGECSYHIVHFIGHGAEESGVVFLLLEDADRRPEKATADLLLRRVPRLFQVRLVFINACKGAHLSHQDASVGLVDNLLQRGIVAVIAHPLEIPDNAATSLTRCFYDGFAGGKSIEDGLVEARPHIDKVFPLALEGYAPALHLRCVDGQLFTVAIQARPQAPGVKTSVNRARQAYDDRRWSEALDYLCEVRTIRPNHDAVAPLETTAQAEEENYHRLLETEHLLALASHYGRAGAWPEALGYYRSYREAMMQSNQSIPERVEMWQRVVRMCVGVRDPALQWKGLSDDS